MYIRLKRQKNTVFMDVESTYNIGRIKMRLKKIPLVEAPENVDDIRIYHPNDTVLIIPFIK